MKTTARFARVAASALIFGLLGMYRAEACNLTDLNFISLTPGPGPNQTLLVRLCIGGGVTGAVQGANGDTRSVGFGFYVTPNVPAFAIISFSPPTMIGSYTTCTMPGADLGPQGPPYNSVGTLFYADPGYYMIPPCVTQPYQCVTTTALCGNVTQQCTDFTIVISRVPDSLRVFGAEGMGNPVAGCYPDADMLIDFTTLPAVWGSISAKAVSNAIQVEWSTIQEINTNHFVVERSSGDADFGPVATIAAAVNSSTVQKYSFIDLAPNIGRNLYRIVLHDKNGATETSSSVETIFGGSPGFAWGAVAPVPASDLVNLTFFTTSVSSVEMQLTDISGKSVLLQQIDARQGTNTLQIDMTSMEAGVYLLGLRSPEGKLSRKLVKL